MTTLGRWVKWTLLGLLGLFLVWQLWLLGWVLLWGWVDPGTTRFMEIRLAELQVKKPEAQLKKTWVPEVQDLLARQKVVEDLVHRQDMRRQEGPRHELVENLVHKQHEAGCAPSSTACTRPTSPTSSRRCRSTSASTSGTWSRPSATARSCSRSPTRCANR
jgi:hypothetical protein